MPPFRTARVAPLLATLVAALVIAACGTGPVATPVQSPTALPSAGATGAPGSPAATPSPPPTSTPATPLPTPSEPPAPSMSPDEAALIAHLRADAAVDCAPRRTGLPDGARYGIECRPADALVARVGIYRFASDREAAYAFLTRMAEQGVDVNAGDCGADVPGEAAWLPGDGEGSLDDPDAFNWENSVLATGRIGCFLDAHGAANVRATCGDTYVGILGRRDDLSDLHDWANRYPVGYEPGTPDAPGICVGPAQRG